MGKLNRIIVILSLCVAHGAFAHQEQQEGAVDGDFQEVEAADEAQLAQPRALPHQRVKDSNIAAPTQNVLILGRGQSQSQGYVQQAPQPQTYVQAQPTTIVEATPLTDSRAAQLRRVRQDTEVQTEQKIAEKLESSRIDDEKKRADRLFGNKLENEEIAPAPAAVQVVPVQQVQQQSNEPSLKEVKEDIINSVKTELNAQKEEKKKDRTYFAGMLGSTEYKDAVNVDSNYAAGFAIGSMLDSGFSVEGTFTWSNLYVTPGYWGYNRSIYEELDQYNIGATVKYSPMIGMVSPNIGATATFTHRVYNQKNDYADTYWNRSIDNESESDAVDLGVVVGLDVHISEKFVIGAEWRYMKNFLTKTDSPYISSDYRYGNAAPLEEFDYSTFAIVGKVFF